MVEGGRRQTTNHVLENPRLPLESKPTSCSRIVERRACAPYMGSCIIRSSIACLDPFPYAGHTTSFDAAWMGVPLITLPGLLNSVSLAPGVTILRNPSAG